MQSVFDYDCHMKTLAQRLKETRLEEGLSQKALGLRAGVSQTTIANIEGGRNKGSTELVAIATALGVRPEWLENEAGPKKSGEATDDAKPADTPQGDVPAGLKKVIAAYRDGGPAKQGALLGLSDLPEHEMAPLLLVIQSIGAKYKR